MVQVVYYQKRGIEQNEGYITNNFITGWWTFVLFYLGFGREPFFVALYLFKLLGSITVFDPKIGKMKNCVKEIGSYPWLDSTKFNDAAGTSNKKDVSSTWITQLFQIQTKLLVLFWLVAMHSMNGDFQWLPLIATHLEQICHHLNIRLWFCKQEWQVDCNCNQWVKHTFTYQQLSTTKIPSIQQSAFSWVWPVPWHFYIPPIEPWRWL